MYLDIRKNKNGTVTYRFTYLDKDGRRRRLPQSKVPPLRSKEEAEAWAKSQAALRDSKAAYIEKKLAWREQYYEWGKLLKRYGEWQKGRAPNSYKSSLSYLERWVFPYFLAVRKAGNVNDWHLAFQDFRDWLAGAEPMERSKKKKPLAVSTQNNVIGALNTFLQCLKAYNLIDAESAKVCDTYPEHMRERRSLDDIITEEEKERLLPILAEEYQPAADFFEVLYETGMRFSEARGLHLGSLFKGEVEEGPLRRELTRLGISYVGYIYLDSQPVYDDGRREEGGEILRKPLKWTREIGPRGARVIPIRSKAVWNILARRYLEQKAVFEKRAFGLKPSNYLLFDDAEWNHLYAALRKAYERLGLKPKSFHCARHTYITNLVGETGSYVLVRMLSGHRSQKSFERYLHIYEQMSRQALAKEQVIGLI